MAANPTIDRDPRHLRWARLTVVAVFVIGLVVVVGPALPHLGSLYRDPFAAQPERRVVETFDGNGEKTGTVVTTSPVGSLIERSLAAGGVLLLRLVVVGAGAFVAGAVVYRTAAGNFPSEIAGVKFAEKTGASVDKLTEATATLAARVATLDARLDGMDLKLEATQAAATEATGAVRRLADVFEDTASEVQDLRQFADAVVQLGDGLASARADVDALKAAAVTQPPPRPTEGQ